MPTNATPGRIIKLTLIDVNRELSTIRIEAENQEPLFFTLHTLELSHFAGEAFAGIFSDMLEHLMERGQREQQ